MPITMSSEDLLPGQGVPVTGPKESASHDTAFAAHGGSSPSAAAALERDISGCFALIGPVQLCYDVNTSIPSVAVSLKVGPVTVISGEINPQHPCLHFKGDYGLAKWDLNICLENSSITLKGKACVTFVGCKEFNVTLFHW